MGKLLHESEPSEIIYFYFCHVAEREHRYKYVLTTKDDLSSYACLGLCQEIGDETAAAALINWFAAFRVI